MHGGKQQSNELKFLTGLKIIRGNFISSFTEEGRVVMGMKYKH